MENDRLGQLEKDLKEIGIAKGPRVKIMKTAKSWGEAARRAGKAARGGAAENAGKATRRNGRRRRRVQPKDAEKERGRELMSEKKDAGKGVRLFPLRTFPWM